MEKIRGGCFIFFIFLQVYYALLQIISKINVFDKKVFTKY